MNKIQQHLFLFLLLVIAIINLLLISMFISNKNWANSVIIIFNISIGYVISYIFWLIVVFVPAEKEKNILKKNFKKQYEFFKHDVIQILIRAYHVYRNEVDNNLQDYTKNQYNLVKKLCSPKEFKKFFTRNQQENWYAVLNGLQYEESFISDLYVEYELFCNNISFFLSKLPINDDEMLTVLRGFNGDMYRLKNLNVFSEDQAKYFGNFIFCTLACWDLNFGDTEDKILKMINKI